MRVSTALGIPPVLCAFTVRSLYLLEDPLVTSGHQARKDGDGAARACQQWVQVPRRGACSEESAGGPAALSGEKHRKSRSLAASEAAKGQDGVFYVMDFRAKQSWTQPGSAAHSRCDRRQVALGASFLTCEEEPRGCPPPGCCRLVFPSLLFVCRQGHWCLKWLGDSHAVRASLVTGLAQAPTLVATRFFPLSQETSVFIYSRVYNFQ